MANEENLIPFSERSKEEARECGRKGGTSSGAARRRKRDAKRAIAFLLNMDANSQLMGTLRKLGYEDGDASNMDAVTAAIFVRAVKGDVNAYRALMEYGGYHPDQKLKDKERTAKIKAMESGTKADDLQREDDPITASIKEDHTNGLL